MGFLAPMPMPILASKKIPIFNISANTIMFPKCGYEILLTKICDRGRQCVKHTVAVEDLPLTDAPVSC